MPHTDRFGGAPAHGDEPVNADVRYEREDVRASGVLWFGFWLAAASVAIYLALWGLFKLFEAQTTRRQNVIPSGVAASLKRTPAEPRLEPLPRAARGKLRAQEDARLSSYGWVNRGGGVARIPIERAMELIVERGVPGGKPLPSPTAAEAVPAGAVGR